MAQETLMNLSPKVRREDGSHRGKVKRASHTGSGSGSGSDEAGSDDASHCQPKVPPFPQLGSFGMGERGERGMGITIVRES